MVHVKVNESQLKKNFFTVILVKIYSLLIYVCKNPPLRSHFIKQRQYNVGMSHQYRWDMRYV